MSKGQYGLDKGPRFKKRRLKRRIKVIISILTVVFLLVAGYGINLYLKAKTVMTEAYESLEEQSAEGERDKSDLRDEFVDPKFDNVSILIMGVDESDTRQQGDVSRTDALLLATLNRENKSVKLLSIPRDSYVYIPHIGYEDKINHAYAFGGRKATVDAVENLLDLPVDYYMTMNFNAFIDVIDAINGVKVDVPYELKEMDSTDKKNAIHLYPGEQLLNGEEALAFARTRKKDSDVERGKRQMEIIEAIIDKSTSLSSFFKYDDIIQAVGNNLQTNMRFSEMKSFFAYAMEGSNLHVEKLTLEGEDYQPSGVYYWKLDDESLEFTVNKLKRHLDLTSYVDVDTEYHSAESGQESVNY